MWFVAAWAGKMWTVERAAAFLRDAHGHFDPRCVAAFLAAWSDVLDVYDQYQDAEIPLL